MARATTFRIALVALALPLAGCVFPGHSRDRDHDHDRGQWRSTANGQDCRYDRGRDNDCGPGHPDAGRRHEDERSDRRGW